MNNRTIALIASSLAAFFPGFVFSGVNISLPAINREFNADAILLSWVVTSQLLTVGVFLLPCGRIADIIGIKKVFIYGLLIYTVGTAIAAFSSSMIMLIASLSLQGLAAAAVFGNSIAIIAAVYPPGERGRALGIYTAALYTGLSLGPFLGGMITEYLGWRSIFLIGIPAYLLVTLLTSWKIKGEWAAATGEKFDVLGSVVYGLALIALMYGFSLLPDVSGALFTVAGILGIVIFLKLESRIGSPVLNVGIFRNNRTFLFSNLAALVSYSATFALVFILSLYLQYIKELTPAQAGSVLITQPLTRALLSPFTGRLSDRLEPRVVCTAGMALTFLGILTFSFLTEGTPVWLIVVALIVAGTGFALFITPNTNAIMSSVEPKFYGVAAATEGTMRTIGQMVSMGITMIAIALITGRVVITPEHYPAFVTSAKTAFGVFTALCFGAIFASLSRGKTKITS